MTPHPDRPGDSREVGAEPERDDVRERLSLALASITLVFSLGLLLPRLILRAARGHFLRLALGLLLRAAGAVIVGKTAVPGRTATERLQRGTMCRL